MATTAERIASGVGFGALAKAEELKKRLWFTVGALIIYRLGTYLPLSGDRPRGAVGYFLAAILGHPRDVRHVLGRRTWAV